jgi:protoheme IX farnesyltransferase
VQKQKSESRIAVYYELTKPKIWYLLVFTAFGAILTASNIYNVEVSPATWALALFSVAAGSAAANTLTNYHDRDIDAIMERTNCNFIYDYIRTRTLGYCLYCIWLGKQCSCLFICIKTKF